MSLPSETPDTGTSISPHSPAAQALEFLTPEELRHALLGVRQSAAEPEPEVEPELEPGPGQGQGRGLASLLPAALLRLRQYPRLQEASRDPLHALQLPPEEAVRAVAVGLPLGASGPPFLVGEATGPLAAVLQGWRSMYQLSSSPEELQGVVGRCYAADAVFEDHLVVAAGQAQVYRQFAALGAATQGVQVTPYSLAAVPVGSLPLPPPPGEGAPPPGQLALVTRVSIENVQTFTFGLPSALTWLLGEKSGALKVPLYVTTVLVVASQQPLLPPQPPARVGGPYMPLRYTPAIAAPAGAVSSSGAATAHYDGNGNGWRILYHADTWHNLPMVWPLLRRTACRALDVVLLLLGF